MYKSIHSAQVTHTVHEVTHMLLSEQWCLLLATLRFPLFFNRLAQTDITIPV
jgi:hypothetical protein